MAYGCEHHSVVPRHGINLGGCQRHNEMVGSDAPLDRHDPSQATHNHKEEGVFPSQPGKNRESLDGEKASQEERTPQQNCQEEEKPFVLHLEGRLHSLPHIGQKTHNLLSCLGL